jgi:hypothetical protein
VKYLSIHLQSMRRVSSAPVLSALVHVLSLLEAAFDSIGHDSNGLAGTLARHVLHRNGTCVQFSC